MKARKFLGAALAALLSTSALAQVNVVPQIGVITALVPRDTYSASALGVSLASLATDVACISGSATRTVYINHISINGIAGTFAVTPVIVYKRNVADTGGTTAIGTANWANTIVQHDTQNPAATASLVTYTGNPTINDATSRILRIRNVTMTTATSVIAAVPTTLDWTSTSFSERPILRGVNEQLCINMNAVSFNLGFLHLSVEWTEE